MTKDSNATTSFNGMTQEEKDLLFRDLCARIPHAVKVKAERIHKDSLSFVGVDDNSYICKTPSGSVICIPFNFDVKPYLRPLSSMTEEEKEELLAKLPTKWNIEIDKFEDFYFDICEECAPDIELFTDIIDWLNKKMFDYRGLIPKGRAIEVTEDNNPYK